MVPREWSARLRIVCCWRADFSQHAGPVMSLRLVEPTTHPGPHLAVSPADFGNVGEVTVTKDDTLLLNGRGDPAEVEARVEEIQGLIEETSSDYEKEKLKERLARLAGGVAVLKIGGASEVEVGEKKVGVTASMERERVIGCQETHMNNGGGVPTGPC